MDPLSVKLQFEALHKYAGWLDRERVAAQVRTEVKALGAALDAGGDPRPQLRAVETALARLPSGELRKMLRLAAGKMRGALGEAQ